MANTGDDRYGACPRVGTYYWIFAKCGIKFDTSNLALNHLFDYYMDGLDAAIIIDEWYKFSGNKQDLAMRRSTDEKVDKWCLENGVPLLRIFWADVKNADNMVMKFIDIVKAMSTLSVDRKKIKNLIWSSKYVGYEGRGYRTF